MRQLKKRSIAGLCVVLALAAGACGSDDKKVSVWMSVDPLVFAGLKKRGAYAFGRYNVLHVAPPLTITDEQIGGDAALVEGS